jgi:predicted RNase H-like HicB family nuclease
MMSPEKEESLPTYPYHLILDVELGGYVAEHLDLEGCAAQGETAEKAIANLDVARELWIEARVEDGLPVPKPGAGPHSGRVSLRIASSVHARLAQHARNCDISLNKLLNSILADAVNGVGPVHGQQRAVSTPPILCTAADLMSLHYTYELVRDDLEDGYFAEHPDLPGCAAQGETAEEAIANLDVARELWIETRLEDSLPIPAPLSEDVSGLISLRMPPSLHAQLVKQAVRNQVSLNLWLNTVLAEFVGSLAAAAPASAPSGRNELTASEAAEGAACLFREGKAGIAEKLLAPWPREQAEFLLGLFYLEAGQGEKAINCFHLAHVAGLDFEVEGTKIYYLVLGRPTARALHENMLPLSHAIDMYSDKYGDIHGEVGGRIVDWVFNRRKENLEPGFQARAHSTRDGFQ